MSFGAWIPFMIAPALTILTMLLTILLLPGDTENAVGERFSCSNDGVSETLDPRSSDECFSSLHMAQNSSWLTRAGTSFMIASIFLTSSLGGQCMGLLLQYSAKKFSWTFAQVMLLSKFIVTFDMTLLLEKNPSTDLLLGILVNHTTSRRELHRSYYHNPGCIYDGC